MLETIKAWKAKTNTERVQSLRQRMAAKGYIRKEIYVHPDDWQQVYNLQLKLRQERELRDGDV